MELPGSAGKLALMMSRIARGEAAFHPDDRMRAWREFIAEELDGLNRVLEECDARGVVVHEEERWPNAQPSDN